MQNYSWRHFFLLLVGFFVAFCLGGLVRTPGSWSDVRSQWLGAALVAVVCVAFLVVTGFSYWGRSTLTGFQATLLALIFGAVLVLMVRELYASAVFLRQVRSSQSYKQTGTPNPAASGNGAVASVFHIQRLGRAVPEPQRWGATMNPA
jgi:Ca2+/H+ antiporter